MDSPRPKKQSLFTEITTKAGLPSMVAPWPDGTYAAPESTPGGIALFDYDNDGDLDIYLVMYPPPGPWEIARGQRAENKLYAQGKDGKFGLVTDAGGLNDGGYGQNVAMGDIDNDGDLDVYVSNIGPDRLFLNDGAGAFADVSSKAGIPADRTSGWSTGAAFVDYDADGFLDLYVANYIVFDPSVVCPGSDKRPDYCGPARFKGTIDILFHNNGDGTFSDVTEAAGINTPRRGFGVVCADFTGDKLIDIYVTNDSDPNSLWVNRGDGTFVDEAMKRGMAISGTGVSEASMGIAVGDVDGNGRFDLLMTHWSNQTNTLYMASDSYDYRDRSASSGLSPIDMPYTGWGCVFFDHDHDGDLDLAVANGRVVRGTPNPGAKLSPFWNDYAEQNLMIDNQGAGQFANISDRAGGFTGVVENTRGLAYGDIDDDGDIDLVTTTLNHTLRVYRNDAPKKENHWLMIRAMEGKRDAMGAKLKLVFDANTPAPVNRIGLVSFSQSYLAGNDPRVHFGLGKAQRVKSVEITWPDGSVETFDVGSVDRSIIVRKGEGKTP